MTHYGKEHAPILVVPKTDVFGSTTTVYPVRWSERDIYDWTPGVRDEVLEAYVRMFRRAVGPDFLFIHNNAKPHRAHIVDDFLEEECIRRMNCSSISPDLSPIEHVWDRIRSAIAQRNPSPRTRQELKAALLEECD